jgi:hypothetical protein
MKRRLTFLRGVADEIAAGVSFYESQSSGLGRRFRNEVALMLRKIEERPLAYPKTAGLDVRKLS